MSEKIYDVVILGSGPAGSTAAIYTSRAELSTLVLAGSPPGGQLMWTTEVENFPGLPEGIMGPELIGNMRKQAEKFGSIFVDDNALKVENAEGVFVVQAQNGELYSSHALIVATGADAKWLGLENEQKLRGKGVSACATCDGFFFKDKVVAVVGGGDASMEEATFLTKFVTKVYLIARGSENELRASKIMLRRALENPKIEFVYNSEVRDVMGEHSVIGVSVFNNKTSQTSTLDVQGMFVAIGHKPNTDFISNLVTVGKGGYAEAKENVHSSVSGLFIAGDVYDHRYRQAITAAGYGCMAALEAEKYISDKFPR